MTTATTSPAMVFTPSTGQLGPRLGELHRQWLQDLCGQMEKARTKDRHIWARWTAIRYVDNVFSDRFERERSAINRLADHPLVWVAGELVSNLCWQLRNSVGLCHRETEFSILAGKLLRAAEHWFATVEDLVGPIKLADLSPEARQELASLGIETAPNWSELPASLATSP